MMMSFQCSAEKVCINCGANLQLSHKVWFKLPKRWALVAQHKGKAAAVTIVKAVRKLKALEEILEKMSGCVSIGAKKWRNTLTNYVKTKLQVDYNKSGISVAKVIIFSRQELLQRS